MLDGIDEIFYESSKMKAVVWQFFVDKQVKSSWVKKWTDLHPMKKEFNASLDVLRRFVGLDNDSKSLYSTGSTHSTEYYVTCQVQAHRHLVKDLTTNYHRNAWESHANVSMFYLSLTVYWNHCIKCFCMYVKQGRNTENVQSKIFVSHQHQDQLSHQLFNYYS